METFSLPGGAVPERAAHLGTWSTLERQGLWAENAGSCNLWWRACIGAGDLNPFPYCYQASFYVMDCALVVCWCYDRSPQGHPYPDGSGGPAELPPRAMILAELPPPQLLGWRGWRTVPVHTQALRRSAELNLESDRESWGWEYGQGPPTRRPGAR